MNDDSEIHRRSPFLVIPGGPVRGARVLAFDASRPRPLFAGWVGADGNVVPMVRPVHLPPKRNVLRGIPVDDEWI